MASYLDPADWTGPAFCRLLHSFNAVHTHRDTNISPAEGIQKCINKIVQAAVESTAYNKKNKTSAPQLYTFRMFENRENKGLNKYATGTGENKHELM